MTEKPVVCICTPSKGETVDTDFCYSLLALGLHTLGHGLLIKHNPGFFRQAISRRRQTPHRARNWLVRYALALPEPKVTHIMWSDDDHVFPCDSIIRLVERDKDIVGCLHRLRAPPYTVIGSLLDPQPDFDMFNAGGLHRAAHLGGGFLMVKRQVYETLAGPWYREISRPEVAGTDTIDTDNVDGDISEDVYFCMLAQSAGFEMWCDLDLTYEVGHKNGTETIWFRNPPPLPPYPLATQ